MTPELFLGKAANAALVLGFFAAAIFFLRYLYGPGGRLRDPEWDLWNEEAEAARLREADDLFLAGHEKAFLAYAGARFGEDERQNGHLRLKIEHSLRVLGYAKDLIGSEKALRAPEMRRPLLLAALYHDIGRFEQLRRYGTFADAASCNHGLLGARELYASGLLQSETAESRRLVLALVALHNRHTLPAGLAGRRLTLLQALRDADKLDILTVMAAHLKPGAPQDFVVMLNVSDEAGSCSPAIVEALEKGRLALYRDMRYANDFRVVLCTWLHDLHFPGSFQLAARDGRYSDILAGLQGVPEVQAKAAALVREKLGLPGG